MAFYQDFIIGKSVEMSLQDIVWAAFLHVIYKEVKITPFIKT